MNQAGKTILRLRSENRALLSTLEACRAELAEAVAQRNHYIGNFDNASHERDSALAANAENARLATLNGQEVVRLTAEVERLTRKLAGMESEGYVPGQGNRADDWCKRHGYDGCPYCLREQAALLAKIEKMTPVVEAAIAWRAQKDKSDFVQAEDEAVSSRLNIAIYEYNRLPAPSTPTKEK